VRQADGSFSLEEQGLRNSFNAARSNPERRDHLWPKLLKARLRWARKEGVLFVRIRLRDDPQHVALCACASLRNVCWLADPRGARRPYRVHAEAPCLFLFKTALPPCERAGDCPHWIPVIVNQRDNYNWPGSGDGVGDKDDDYDNTVCRIAYRQLRLAAGEQPKLAT